MTAQQLERVAPVILGVIVAGAVLACICLCSLLLRGTWHPWRRILELEPEPEPEPTWMSASGIEYRETDAGLMVRVDGTSSDSGTGWPAGIISDTDDDAEKTEKHSQKGA